MVKAIDVAQYFVSRTNEDEGDLATNLQIQKLLYYAQGLSLAVYDQPIFNEEIQAWLHGPVVPEVYQEFKKYGSGPIPPLERLDASIFTTEQLDIMDEVWNCYGQFSAWRL